MPKVLEYPRASLRASLDLSKAVSDLGGSAKVETVAEKMGLKVSGSFQALMGAAKKYGLVETSRGQLSVTGLYREYKHAYSDDEAAKVLRKAFFGIPLFQKVYDRFRDAKLPVDILDRMLIREFEVDETMASRVAGYLLEAGRLAKLLDGDNSFIVDNVATGTGNSLAKEELGEESEEIEDVGNSESASQSETKIDAKQYIIHFKGPGIDSKIQVNDEDDLQIVEAILSKIKKKLKEPTENLISQ